jgi:hypothetical protein
MVRGDSRMNWLLKISRLGETIFPVSEKRWD